MNPMDVATTRMPPTLELTIELTDEQFFQRWDALTPEQQEKFPPICPDFVVELRSQECSLEKSPTTVSGEDVLPGFVLDFNQII